MNLPPPFIIVSNEERTKQKHFFKKKTAYKVQIDEVAPLTHQIQRKFIIAANIS